MNVPDSRGRISALGRKIVFVCIQWIMLMCGGCKDESGPLNPPNPLPSNAAIYLSLDGGNNNAGVFILGTDSLRLIDSLITGTGVPFTVEFSRDSSTWYSIWSERPDTFLTRYVLHSVDTRTTTILESVSLEFPLPFLAMDNTGDLLIVHGNFGIQVFDRLTLSPLRTDTSLGYTAVIAPSHRQPGVFAALVTDRRFRGIAQYDLQTQHISVLIPIADSIRQAAMEPASLVVSPDEQYAYLSVFNWQGLGGYNSFFVIDLARRTVIAEYRCGAFAQLSVSHDGSSVYITDPAGYLYQLPPTHTVLRYNVQSRQLETFLDAVVVNGTRHDIITTDKIRISPDGVTMYVSSFGGITIVDGKTISLMALDIPSKRVLATYSLPVDARGYVTQLIRNITLGPRPARKGG